MQVRGCSESCEHVGIVNEARSTELAITAAHYPQPPSFILGRLSNDDGDGNVSSEKLWLYLTVSFHCYLFILLFLCYSLYLPVFLIIYIYIYKAVYGWLVCLFVAFPYVHLTIYIYIYIPHAWDIWGGFIA